MNQCVMLNVSHTKTLMDKRETSSKEYDLMEEKLVSAGAKKFTSESLLVPVKRFRVIRKMKDSVWEARYKVKNELSNSYYLIGGVIPFVVERDGWGEYTGIALLTALYSFPVTIIDWVSLPFRLGVSEELKTENQTEVVKETQEEIKDSQNMQIKINKENIKFQKGELIIPYRTIADKWVGNKSFLFKWDTVKVSYEILGSSPEKEREIPLNTIINQEDYHEVLLADSLNRPQVYKYLLTYFSYKVCLVDKIYPETKPMMEKTVETFRKKYLYSKDYCIFLMLNYDNQWSIYAYDDKGEFRASKVLNKTRLDEILQGEKNVNALLTFAADKIGRTLDKTQDLRVIDYLLKQGYSLNYKTESISSPLEVACLMDNLELAQYLIYRGADVNYKGEDGLQRTVIFRAILKNNLNMVKYLVEKGADINVHFDKEPPHTPLQAAEYSYLDPEIKKYLISKGAK